jgi:large subunit ribosomal protein L15
MKLGTPRGAVKKKKVVGRGQGCGRGCTSGRGSNGQKSRSGYSMKIGFEGGQMPLVRRIPKRGFNNFQYEKAFQIINLRDLERFKEGDVIDYETLLVQGLVNHKVKFVKLLGKGELTKKLHIKVHRASKQAVAAVEKAGGKVELLG